VVQLSTPIKIAALHSALTGLLHPGRVAAGAARTVIAGTGAEAAKQDLRILLADDNPINQQVGQLILESMGYRADLAGNGVEVLDALQRQPYDVILMDVHMPEMDGWEASRRVRREFPGDLQPRIIAMTAGILEEEKEKCLEAGMEDFVSKPVRSEELKRALEKKAPKKDKRSAPEASPDEPDFDLAVLAVLRSANRPGQRDLVEELLGVYRKMLPGHLEEIRQAAAKRDWKTLEHAAHKLRGSSANLGANRIATVCTTLENLGKKGSPDGMDEAVHQLETLIARVCSGKR
jgi:CheY-like chemotaxis protein/HPt (histidine-containing phosphotransfer) domain-containing protein